MSKVTLQIVYNKRFNELFYARNQYLCVTNNYLPLANALEPFIDSKLIKEKLTPFFLIYSFVSINPLLIKPLSTLKIFKIKL